MCGYRAYNKHDNQPEANRKMNRDKWHGRYQLAPMIANEPGSFPLEASTDFNNRLQHEFAGQNQLLLEHAITVIAIRDAHQLKTNIEHFYELWSENEFFLMEMLDTPWLISACDTIVTTSSDQHELDIALKASEFGHAVKIVESERGLLNANTTQNLQNSSSPISIKIGVSHSDVEQNDKLKALTGQLQLLNDEDTLASRLFLELIDRQYRADTVLHRMHAAESHSRLAIELKQKPFQPDVSGFILTGTRSHSTQRGFIIVNDTSVLSGGFHIGPLAVINTIQSKMEKRGLSFLGSANDAEGTQQLVTKYGNLIKVIVLNGEGTLHHNAKRGFQLMNTCLAAASDLQSKSALVNVGWEANSIEFAQLASEFDHVEFRDQASMLEFESTVGNGYEYGVTPDLSLNTFFEYASGIPQTLSWAGHQNTQKIGVIDCVVAKKSAVLQDLAEGMMAPFYSMTKNHAYRLRQRSIENQRSGYANPRILALRHFISCDKWVTGRYHGLLALLAVGKPFVAVGSNTSKIQNMLRDIGLPPSLVMSDQFVDMDTVKQSECVLDTFSLWTPAMQEDVTAFVMSSQTRIDAFFDRLAGV